MWLKSFLAQSHFGNDGTQNDFVFQPLIKYFEFIKTKYWTVIWWTSKSFSDPVMKSRTTSNNILNPKLVLFNIPRFRVKLDESYLKTVSESFTLDEIKFLHCLRKNYGYSIIATVLPSEIFYLGLLI